MFKCLLMEIIRSLNRSWIYETYFSLYRAIHPRRKSGGNVRGEMPLYPIFETIGRYWNGSSSCLESDAILFVGDHCLGVVCSGRQFCIVDKEYRTSCVCPDEPYVSCDGYYEPICGSDNQTYDSYCHMSTAECKTNTSITHRSIGFCSKGQAGPTHARPRVCGCGCVQVCIQLYEQVGAGTGTYGTGERPPKIRAGEGPCIFPPNISRSS